jgi:glyoxylase-like metal-dependent hydrolase (beta-lactamase superfamily II)
MQLGDFELTPLLDGTFRLDGGAMFGVVPKTLWEKRAPADDRNRITMAMRPLLVRPTGSGPVAPLMLIDAGCGDKMDAKSADIYGFDRRENLDVTMARAGVRAEDIRIVVASHLHFDHAGGFTARDDPVVCPGVRVRRTGGHTRFHQIVYLESGGQTAVFAADLIPTAAHVDVPWIMAYDLYPMETLEFKRAFVREAIEREYIIFFEHDPKIAAGIIRQKDRRPYVEPIA